MFSLKFLFVTLSLLSRYLLCRERILLTKLFLALIKINKPMRFLVILIYIPLLNYTRNSIGSEPSIMIA